MKVVFKLAVVFLVLFFGMMIYGSIKSEELNEKENKISARHCELDWSTANDSIKEIALNEFLANDGIDPLEGGFKSPSMVAAELLPKYVKYPETIMIGEKPFEGWIYLSSGTIENLEEGVVSFSKNFTSKNKLGMEVRSSFIMTLKYQAGCNNFELIDFVVG